MILDRNTQHYNRLGFRTSVLGFRRLN